MVAKCFYCKATNVEIAHIKDCAKSNKATVATAVPALVAVTAPAPFVPAHHAAMAALKAQNAALSVVVPAAPPILLASTPAPVAEKVKPQDMELGFYFKDDDAYKIVLNKSGTMKYAMKLFVVSTWGKNGKGLKGSWQYVSGAIYDLQPEHKMTKEIADNYAASTLEKYGVAFCCVCGRKLTAKESVAKSMGPVCSGKL